MRTVHYLMMWMFSVGFTAAFALGCCIEGNALAFAFQALLLILNAHMARYNYRILAREVANAP